MSAVRLHGPRDLRIERLPVPGTPEAGQVLLSPRCTSLCGSDLHSYLEARIGDTPVSSPLILGHEFSAVVESAGAEALDGNFEPLRPGTRVAVDPAQPCNRCESCEHGHPNLCAHMAFCGVFPHDGSLCGRMLMPARCCFPVPDAIDDTAAALLEPLGVALHAMDLAKPRLTDSLAILGAGPIGLLLLQLARLSGIHPVFVTDKFDWRLRLAEKFGGIPISIDTEDAVRRVQQETRGRGLDVVIEAAWGGESVRQATEMARPGGRLVLVGIPDDDRLEMKHSTARRKGLTLLMSRRMKHTYPRAISLALRGAVDLHGLVTHCFPLDRASEAFELNAGYRDNVIKVIVENP
jgi:L-iditol 2-dehydrogenase